MCEKAGNVIYISVWAEAHHLLITALSLLRETSPSLWVECVYSALFISDFN